MATLASAMDVGNPSNIERLRWLASGSRGAAGADRCLGVDDKEIRETIRRDWQELGVRGARIPPRPPVFPGCLPRGARGHWVIVATAHPAKFNEIVEPLMGREAPIPPSLAKLLALPRQETELRADVTGVTRRDAEALMFSFPDKIPAWAWPAAVAVVLIALGVWGYLLFRAWRTRRAIDAAISSVAYEVLKNVLLPNGNGGQIHVNYLLLTQRGLLVVDLLDRPGAIFGGDQMIEWTAIGKKRRYTFANPQHALYDRMAAVKLLTGDVPVEGRLLFTLRSEFPKGKPRNVVRIDDLAEDFPLVDKARANITAAFGDVWANVKKHAEPNPLTV